MAKALAVEIRTLRDSELPQVHDLVLDASAIYPVPIRPSIEQLGSMLERRGVDWASSFGAFSDGRLIGATLTAVDEWPALHMGAYAIVSAVRNGWQGKGVLGLVRVAELGAGSPRSHPDAARGVDRQRPGASGL
jgi:hypothetical protein